MDTKAITRAGTLTSNDWLADFASAIYRQDHRAYVQIGSELLEINRALPLWDQNGPDKAAILRDAVTKFEAKLRRRGIDPDEAREIAAEHVKPMAVGR